MLYERRVPAAISSLLLTDFRSYARAELALDGRPVFLVGPNGAGKTNLLEAISLLIPGKGLRGSSISEMGRRMPGEALGRAWAVSAIIDDIRIGPTRIGTGIEQAGAARRTVRVEGEPVPPGRLAEHLRQVWLTPAQDRLFLEGAGERRKFLDRLVFAGQPSHATYVGAYDKASRERMRLLTDETGPPDPAWLDALEAQMVRAGALMAASRAETVAALQAEIDIRGMRPFPQARLALTSEWTNGSEVEARLAPALAAGRARDAAAGRALSGPHRGDLAVVHAEKDRPAAECSTGEQKALILNLVLAQAARLARADDQPAPILLLDEVAAHLDARRRTALFDEIEALGLQAFLTGTDAVLFEAMEGRAQGLVVDAAGIGEGPAA